MRTCPNCAEENPEEATRCRSCGGLFAGDAPWVEALPPPPDDEVLQYTHSGRRYLLGYGRDFFGVWDRALPGRPIARYPRTDAGWRQAWSAFADREPESTEVGMGPAGTPRGAPSSATPVPRPAPRRVSAAWWLLPIFMGWLGGLIAWLVTKDVEPDRARAMLVTGIAISVAVFILVAIQTASTMR